MAASALGRRRRRLALLLIRGRIGCRLLALCLLCQVDELVDGDGRHRHIALTLQPVGQGAAP